MASAQWPADKKDEPARPSWQPGWASAPPTADDPPPAYTDHTFAPGYQASAEREPSLNVDLSYAASEGSGTGAVITQQPGMTHVTHHHHHYHTQQPAPTADTEIIKVKTKRKKEEMTGE